MRTILLFIFILFSIRIFPQDVQTLEKPENKTIHTLGFSAGITGFHLRDEYLSPCIFSGNMFSTGMAYEVQTKNFYHILDFGYKAGHLNSDDQPRSVTEKTGFFSYSVFRRISTKQICGNPLRMSIGAGVSAFVANTDFIARDDNYSYEWPEQSWYCSNSANLHFRGDYELYSGKSFFLQFSLPVVSLVSRPENGHNLNESNTEVMNKFYKVEFQGKPEFFWQNLPVICKAGYKQPVGKKCNFRVDYLFEYFHSGRPMPLRMYMNQVQAGMDFNF